MTSLIREILKDFQPIDSNKDFKVDQLEIQQADRKADIVFADKNGDKVVTIEEYLSFRKASCEALAVSKIFSENLLNKFNAKLEQCSITDPYERLFLISGIIVNNGDESNYDVGIENYLKPIAEQVPELGLIGLTESQIVNSADYYSQNAKKGMITKALAALDELQFNSEQEKREFLKSIISETPYYLTALAKHLQSAIGAYSGLGLTDSDIKVIIKKDPFALKYATDMISVNAKLKLFDSSELASFTFVKTALSGKRKHLSGLYIFDDRLESTVGYLRKAKVSEEDIKTIIKSASRYFSAGGIIESMPKVMKGLKLAGLDPVADLKKYLGWGDVNNPEAFYPFLTFADNVKWMKSASKSKDELHAIIDECFSNGADFNSVRNIFEAAKDGISEDKRLRWAAKAASRPNYGGYADDLKQVFSQLKEMNISAEEKELFADIISASGFPDLRRINSCVKKMRDYKIKDDLIISTVSGFVGFYGKAGPNYLEYLMNFASRLDIYQNGDEMGTFLDIMYFNKCCLSKAVAGCKSLDDKALENLKNDPLWPEVIKTFRYNEIVELFGYAYDSGFFDGKITLAEVAADCKWLDGNKISHWSRYNKDIVKKMQNPVPNEPLAFISLPGHDHNGAFEARGLDKVIEKYNLKLAEPYQEAELYEALEKEKDDSIDSLVLGGHGTPKTLAFSEGYDEVEASKIDMSDDEIKKYLKKVKDGGRIILLSCSTGQELADQMRKWCEEIGKNVEIIAPPIDVSSELFIDKDGKINVHYYNNGSEVEGARFVSMGTN